VISGRSKAAQMLWKPPAESYPSAPCLLESVKAPVKALALRLLQTREPPACLSRDQQSSPPLARSPKYPRIPLPSLQSLDGGGAQAESALRPAAERTKYWNERMRSG